MMNVLLGPGAHIASDLWKSPVLAVTSLHTPAQATGGGGEPSDAVRAVNALLTQLDLLRRKPNVMVLTTSNITQVRSGRVRLGRVRLGQALKQASNRQQGKQECCRGDLGTATSYLQRGLPWLERACMLVSLLCLGSLSAMGITVAQLGIFSPMHYTQRLHTLLDFTCTGS
jgi:hypothetical protein